MVATVVGSIATVFIGSAYAKQPNHKQSRIFKFNISKARIDIELRL